MRPRPPPPYDPVAYPHPSPLSSGTLPTVNRRAAGYRPDPVCQTASRKCDYASAEQPAPRPTPHAHARSRRKTGVEPPGR